MDFSCSIIISLLRGIYIYTFVCRELGSATAGAVRLGGVLQSKGAGRVLLERLSGSDRLGAGSVQDVEVVGW